MKASDFESSYDNLNTESDLLAVLAKRYVIDGVTVNSFWLAHGSGFPLMSILVKGDLATIWYTDHQDNPGSNSVGSVQERTDGEGTIFYLNREQQWIPNESVLTVSEANLAAREFLKLGMRPKCIKWLDL